MTEVGGDDVSSFRSHLTVALAAALLAAFVATGLQAALAGTGSPEPEGVASGDVYYRTRVWTCAEGGSHGDFARMGVDGHIGDEAMGGVGWVMAPTDTIVNLAAVNLADHPVKTRGWRVVSASGNIGEGYTVEVRVYCANTG